VIAGTARGRKLKPPADRSVRPTSDRVREAVYDLLGPGRTAERVLDLFAGTGAMGIEALSRGAGQAVFVDSDRTAVALIKANLLACGFAERASVERRDVLRFLSAEPASVSFDLVLVDPPYGRGLVVASLERLASGAWLAAGARVVCEAEAGLALAARVGPLERLRQRTYGDTGVHLYERLDPADRG